MTPNWKRLALSIARCNAAYVVDPAEAAKQFAALGCTFIAQYRDDSHQAVLSHDPLGKFTLTISGTRFSEGAAIYRIEDVLRDIDWTPIEIEPGVLVARGAHAGMDKVWGWVNSYVDLNNIPPIDVEGHSLGGWRTAYTPLFVKPAQIGKLTRFEPPKAGNLAYWQKYLAGIDMTTVVNRRDPFFAWPWDAGDRLVQPPGDSLIWLRDASPGWCVCSEAEWPGMSTLDPTFSDHGPDTVITAINALAA